MAQIILNLYLLSVICCLVIDISGAVTAFKSLIAAIIRLSGLYNIKASSLTLKPLDCSLCMSVWCGIIYLYASGNFTVPPIAACLFIACASRYTAGAIQTIYSIFDKLLYEINKFTNI